jgi:L-alanine-DL-glutamate epimerase-like enolase superfamily enzyme
MKVKRIEAHHITVPLIAPYKLSKKYGTVTHAQAVITRVHTDDGRVGIGEANPMPPFTEETWGSVFAALDNHLGPLLLGTDPRNITANNAQFDAALSGNLLAKGSLDVALWDLLGKSLDAPVHRLLGGALRSEIPLLWPLGSGTPQQDVERIRAKMKEGYRTFMIKMGALPIDTEIARCRAIVETFGETIQYNVDANQGWDLAQTLAFMEGTRGLPMDFVEQPLPRTAAWGLPEVRARATHPLSADEGVQTLQDATSLAAAHAVDIFSLKISKNGGITRTWQVGQVAAAFGMRCLMNSMIECGVSQAAALHVGAALPNLWDSGQCYMSTERLKDDVTNFGSLIKDAVVTVPDGPGLGITLDEDRLQKYTNASLVIE